MSWRLAVLFALSVAGCNFSFNPDVDDDEPAEEKRGSTAEPTIDASTTFDASPSADAPPSEQAAAAQAAAAQVDAAQVDAAPSQARDAGTPCDGGCLQPGCQPCDAGACTSSDACVPICLPCWHPASSS